MKIQVSRTEEAGSCATCVDSKAQDKIRSKQPLMHTFRSWGPVSKSTMHKSDVILFYSTQTLPMPHTTKDLVRETGKEKRMKNSVSSVGGTVWVGQTCVASLAEVHHGVCPLPVLSACAFNSASSPATTSTTCCLFCDHRLESSDAVNPDVHFL